MRLSVHRGDRPVPELGTDAVDRGPNLHRRDSGCGLTEQASGRDDGRDKKVKPGSACNAPELTIETLILS